MNVWGFSLIIVAFSLLACEKKETRLGDFAYRVVSLPENSIDVMIPVALWDLIEKVDPNSKINRESLVIKKFATVTLLMAEKTEGVLGGRNHEVQFARGGGIIDLADYVTSQKGTFKVGFRMGEEDLQNHPKIYYVSNVKKRKIDGQVWGSGCKTFLDVSSHFVSKTREFGFEVNTTQNRHLAVLSGTFVFVLEKGNNQFISQVTIVDSRQPQLQCTQSVEL